MKIGIDLDGTAMNYSPVDAGENRLNIPFLSQFTRNDEIVIVTNQGGIPFNVAGNPKYPSAWLVAQRIFDVQTYLTNRGVGFGGVHVSLWHEKVSMGNVVVATDELKQNLASAGVRFVSLYRIPQARKPKPGMLLWSGIEIYYGDSDEDREAAAAANVPFVMVPRFK